MPNTKSAIKAVRGSKRKNAHNLFWKKKMRDALKDLKKSLESGDKEEVLNEKLKSLQKILDKSSKEKVIHKNKANRVKSIYARKIAALSKAGPKSKPGNKSTK
jgi:small subunit ribosomal protein S20